jgi:8-oxo-dGTP diphosphatase
MIESAMNSFDLSSYKVSPLSMVFLIEGNKVLTLRRKASKQIYPNKISGFGGKMEPGETLEASARREFLEETGLLIRDISLRGTFLRIVDNGYINELYIFVAHGYNGEVFEVCEEGEIAWRDVDEYLCDPDIVDHIPYYLKQVINGIDFYAGISMYLDGVMVEYTDNRGVFQERRK